MKITDFAKIFLTMILAPTAAFIGIYGSVHEDGSQVVLGVAIMTFLGLIWGPPDKSGGGGSHAK